VRRNTNASHAGMAWPLPSAWGDNPAHHSVVHCRKNARRSCTWPMPTGKCGIKGARAFAMGNLPIGSPSDAIPVRQP